MIGGVSFQPGQNDPTKIGQKPSAERGVQEAIKILSLRLPKVVGARALAPSALLNAQGSGGNPRVDSVVNTVLQRFLPGGAGAGQAPPAAPMIPAGAPTGGGFTPGAQPPPNMPLSDFFPTGNAAPRITPGDDQPRPPVIGDRPTTPGGREDVTPPSGGIFPANPDLPTYDREAGWGPAPVAPPAPTQDPWADLMEYLRRQPAPPQETYSI